MYVWITMCVTASMCAYVDSTVFIWILNLMLKLVLFMAHNSVVLNFCLPSDSVCFRFSYIFFVLLFLCLLIYIYSRKKNGFMANYSQVLVDFGLPFLFAFFPSLYWITIKYVCLSAHTRNKFNFGRLFSFI